jgi:hypothetical protein
MIFFLTIISMDNPSTTATVRLQATYKHVDNGSIAFTGPVSLRLMTWGSLSSHSPPAEMHEPSQSRRKANTVELANPTHTISQWYLMQVTDADTFTAPTSSILSGSVAE